MCSWGETIFPHAPPFLFACSHGSRLASRRAQPASGRVALSFASASRAVGASRRTKASGAAMRYNGAVRFAPVLLVALILAGYGNDVDVELVWGGPPDAGPGGAV